MGAKREVGGADVCFLRGSGPSGGDVLILGINAYHGDASACLLVDGRPIAAVEEERFSRHKHQAGFPSEAVRWVLSEAGAKIGDVDHVAISRNPIAHLHRKFWRVVVDRPDLSSLRDRASNQREVLGVASALAEALDVGSAAVEAKIHKVEHHRAHLASAFFASPFEKAVAVSLDGMGDFSSGMWARGMGSGLDVRGGVRFPHSLGVYYTAFTQFLGMPSYGDEYKLMGLAAYGHPRFLPQVREVLKVSDTGYELNLDYFVHHQQGVDMTWASGSPQLGPLWSPRMIEDFGPAREPRGEVTDRDCDLAASVQARLEEVELELLRRIHAENPNPNLVMAGGVALNCTVNGMIRDETPFEELWIQPAANDSGTSLGAAQWVWHEVLGKPRDWVQRDVYFGPIYDDSVIDSALADSCLNAAVFDDEKQLSDVVAGHVADGAIVGWYQGRSEMGPRALGNRSIVCDPRRHDMKDILNARIKNREPFRPFAPSVLAEAAGDWFDQDYPSPFMLMTYAVRPEKRDEVPAITHEDGTGRLQMVERDVNPRYYDLIAAFGRKTGVPMVLNTSFNENEPIVNTPAEAIDCFLRTDMDVLVLGNRVVTRAGEPSPA